MQLFADLYKASESIFDRPSAWSPIGDSVVPGGTLAAGETVSEARMLADAAIYAAIRNLAEDTAKLPAYVVRVDEKGDKQRVDAHAVTRLFEEGPNNYQNPFAFRAQVTHWKIGWGNGYAEIERDARMNPIALHPRHPGTIQPFYDEATGRIAYKHLQHYRFIGGKLVDKTERIIDADNMLHIRGIGGDALEGYSVIRVAAESYSAMFATQAFAASSFKNRGAVSSVITHPGDMGEEAREYFKESFDKAYRGARKAGGWILLEDGMTYNQYSISPDDMQFIQTRTFQIDEVCRWFRIPPSKIQHLVRASYNSLEQQDDEYENDCIQTHVIEWEQESKRKLFRMDESDLRLYHNMNARLRGDIRAQTEHITKGIQNGIYTINQALSFMGQNTVGPVGDKRFIASNMMEINTQPVVKPVANPTPPAPVAPQPATPRRGAIGPEQVRVILSQEVTRAQRKADKAIPRIEKRHEGDPEALVSGVRDFYEELRSEIVVNLSPVWLALGGDDYSLACAVSAGGPDHIEYEQITDALVEAFGEV